MILTYFCTIFVCILSIFFVYKLLKINLILKKYKTKRLLKSAKSFNFDIDFLCGLKNLLEKNIFTLISSYEILIKKLKDLKIKEVVSLSNEVKKFVTKSNYQIDINKMYSSFKLDFYKTNILSLCLANIIFQKIASIIKKLKREENGTYFSNALNTYKKTGKDIKNESACLYYADLYEKFSNCLFSLQKLNGLNRSKVEKYISFNEILKEHNGFNKLKIFQRFDIYYQIYLIAKSLKLKENKVCLGVFQMALENKYSLKSALIFYAEKNQVSFNNSKCIFTDNFYTFLNNKFNLIEDKEREIETHNSYMLLNNKNMYVTFSSFGETKIYLNSNVVLNNLNIFCVDKEGNFFSLLCPPYYNVTDFEFLYFSNRIIFTKTFEKFKVSTEIIVNPFLNIMNINIDFSNNFDGNVYVVRNENHKTSLEFLSLNNKNISKKLNDFDKKVIEKVIKFNGEGRLVVTKYGAKRELNFAFFNGIRHKKSLVLLEKNAKNTLILDDFCTYNKFNFLDIRSIFYFSHILSNNGILNASICLDSSKNALNVPLKALNEVANNKNIINNIIVIKNIAKAEEFLCLFKAIKILGNFFKKYKVTVIFKNFVLFDYVRKRLANFKDDSYLKKYVTLKISNELKQTQDILDVKPTFKNLPMPLTLPPFDLKINKEKKSVKIVNNSLCFKNYDSLSLDTLINPPYNFTDFYKLKDVELCGLNFRSYMFFKMDNEIMSVPIGKSGFTRSILLGSGVTYLFKNESNEIKVKIDENKYQVKSTFNEFYFVLENENLENVLIEKKGNALIVGNEKIVFKKGVEFNFEVKAFFGKLNSVVKPIYFENTTDDFDSKSLIIKVKAKEFNFHIGKKVENHEAVIKISSSSLSNDLFFNYFLPKQVISQDKSIKELFTKTSLFVFDNELFSKCKDNIKNVKDAYYFTICYKKFLNFKKETYDAPLKILAFIRDSYKNFTKAEMVYTLKLIDELIIEIDSYNLTKTLLKIKERLFEKLGEEKENFTDNKDEDFFLCYLLYTLKKVDSILIETKFLELIENKEIKINSAIYYMKMLINEGRHGEMLKILDELNFVNAFLRQDFLELRNILENNVKLKYDKISFSLLYSFFVEDLICISFIKGNLRLGKSLLKETKVKILYGKKRFNISYKKMDGEKIVVGRVFFQNLNTLSLEKGKLKNDITVAI